MLRKSIVVWMAVGVLTQAPAMAEEIIYFTNGSSLPVRGHVVEGDMIKVDLGNDGFMAFPNAVVERIVEAGSDVVLRPSLTNIIDGSSSNRVYATPPQQRDTWALPDEVQTPSAVTTDSRGVSVLPVFPGSDHRGRSQMMSSNVSGSGTATAGSQGMTGAERQGVGQVIHEDPAQFSPQRKKYVGLQQRK